MFNLLLISVSDRVLLSVGVTLSSLVMAVVVRDPSAVSTNPTGDIPIAATFALIRCPNYLVTVSCSKL